MPAYSENVLKINREELAKHWWLMPVILATQKAKIRRIAVQSQPRQIVLKFKKP
jgi:hypothetical protein